MMSASAMNKCLNASRRYHNKALKCIEQGLKEADQAKKEQLSMYAQMYFRQSHHYSDMIMREIREREEVQNDNQ